MRKFLLALTMVMVFGTFVLAAHVDPALTDLMNGSKGLLPVIVQMQPGQKSVDVTTLGGKMGIALPVINGFAAQLPATAINALGKNPNVFAISYDQTVRIYMNIAAPTVGSNRLWTEGYDGDGVTVAVLDTGISQHQDFGSRIVGFKDLINSRTTTYDDNGHGSHLAGIIAGADTTYKGIAPHAKLVGVKVMNSTGSASISTIISGIDWVISNKTAYGIKIAVLAVGGSVTQSSTTDPMCAAVRNLVNNGIVAVTTAGSSGIGCPGNEPLGITAGTSDDKGTTGWSDDTVASFSAHGPTAIDGWAKPDLLAPGVTITSCNNATTGYVTMSGTSMSTAVVAGICAQVLEAYPSWTPATVKSNLKGSCHNLGYDIYTQGSGLVDAYYSVH